MQSDLDQILAADEEARSRVTFAEKRLARDVATARAETGRAAESRRKAAETAVEAEIATIHVEGELAIADLRQRNQEYLEALRKTGEREMETAAATYAAIVRGVS